MHRLVIALTALLSLTGALVVVGYLLLFGAAADQAARLVPADAAVYVNVYLQPSTGQQMNLSSLMGRLPGFGDAAALDEKVDVVMQNLLSGSGLDYRADIKPWLGDQLAVAGTPDPADPAGGDFLLIAQVRDRPEAEAALARLAEGATASEYQGAQLFVGETGAYTFVDELLVFASSEGSLQAAIDTHRGAEPALAEEQRFRSAMERLPADHLASVYVDFQRLAAAAGAAGAGTEMTGLSTASLALIAEESGLRLAGQAPYQADDAAAALGTSTEAATLTEWMPATTQAEAVIVGLRQAFEAAEAAAGGSPDAEAITDGLATLRGMAALGFGLSFDDDLLPLFDGETAVAVRVGADGVPTGTLLLRPTDAQVAETIFARIRAGLVERDIPVTDAEGDGSTVTTIAIPQVGELSYAIDGGVAILGLQPADVAAAIAVHASGETLTAEAGYEAAFDLAGGRGGNELYVDIASLVDGFGAVLDMPDDVRAILAEVDAFALTASVHDDLIEFNSALTVE